MRLSDLQIKDIVNINDGKKIGKIIDAEITETGNIVHLVVERKTFLFSKDNETNITFNQIKKIGTDVILVDIMI